MVSIIDSINLLILLLTLGHNQIKHNSLLIGTLSTAFIHPDFASHCSLAFDLFDRRNAERVECKWHIRGSPMAVIFISTDCVELSSGSLVAEQTDKWLEGRVLEIEFVIVSVATTKGPDLLVLCGENNLSNPIEKWIESILHVSDVVTLLELPTFA